MTTTPSATGGGRPPSSSGASQGWAQGLTVFAAVILMVGGILDILRGIMAIADDDVFVATPNYVFQFNLTSWGWIHLVFGVVAVLVAYGLFSGAVWARAAGVVIASLIIIGSFLSLPYYPVWSVVMIAFSALVIWALCVRRTDSAGY